MPPAPYGMELADRYDIEIDNYDRFIGFSSQLISVDTGAAAGAYAALIGDRELRRRKRAPRSIGALSWRRRKNYGPILPTGAGCCGKLRRYPTAMPARSRWRICRAPIRSGSSPATRPRRCTRIASSR